MKILLNATLVWVLLSAAAYFLAIGLGYDKPDDNSHLYAVYIFLCGCIGWCAGTSFWGNNRSSVTLTIELHD